MMVDKVTFYSEGQRLFGNLHLPHEKIPCIITLHGFESNKDSGKWSTIATRFYNEGYACLRFNFRGCGEGIEKSDGKFEDVSLTSRIKDFMSAIQFLNDLEKVDMSRLGIIGSSFGGMIALATQEKRIKAIVNLSTPYKLSLKSFKIQKNGDHYELPSGRRIKKEFFKDLRKYNLLKAIEKTPPIMIIHGSFDEMVPLNQAYELFKAAQKPKRLEIIEKGDHAFSKIEHQDKIIDLSLKWFKKYVV